MNKVLGYALTFISTTFIIVLLISIMDFNVSMQRMNNYHYATVHEIESSDFANSVIVERVTNGTYDTQITQKSVKEDMQIYEVKTSTTLSIPILGYSTTYLKESIAR